MILCLYNPPEQNQDPPMLKDGDALFPLLSSFMVVIV